MNTPALDHEALGDLLRAALAAFDGGDETRCRECIETLAEWRSRPLYTTCSRMVRVFNADIAALPLDGRLGALAGHDLPDARARLDYVIRMTEEATHRTLDLIEDSRSLLDGLRDAAQQAQADAAWTALRRNLSQVTLAQEYQDLTGQIIRRVVDIVHHVEAGIAEIGVVIDDKPQPQDPERSRLSGPAVPGLDMHAVSQNDADDLLSGLGL